PDWQPISRLPLIGSMIDGMLQDAEEHYQTLLQASPKPHVLDDYTVGRVFEVFGSCHLQLNRGAARLETDFAIKSGAKSPILQLNRGANTSHFCHWRPFNPTRWSVPPRSDLLRIWLVRRFEACAGPRAFP